MTAAFAAIAMIHKTVGYTGQVSAVVVSNNYCSFALVYFVIFNKVIQGFNVFVGFFNSS